ncbi:MAG TPA: gluconate 2-dehydrogenase subunit 3 family protein [Crenalkalicoccus sp.]|nr:gluconate 2-dehydrogenase subunit 3 family protein [Crenalkalicoccus sp.]
MAEPSRFPGYSTLAKRDTPSWNVQTRRVVDQRLALPPGPRFLDAAEYRTLEALCARILPQPPERAEPVPLAATLDAKLLADHGDGYREASMPPQREAWRRGLRALEAEAEARFGAAFHACAPARQDELLHAIHRGEARSDAWGDMPPAGFFKHRVLHDVTGAYYAHPTAWDEIGFGGPASPRGYVRMGYDRRDPWEAAERQP